MFFLQKLYNFKSSKRSIKIFKISIFFCRISILLQFKLKIYISHQYDRLVLETILTFNVLVRILLVFKGKYKMTEYIHIAFRLVQCWGRPDFRPSICQFLGFTDNDYFGEVFISVNKNRAMVALIN